VCGDGIVDQARGEQCDEANQVRGDGCEPVTCAYSCDQDADCDDVRVCNGAERCDLATHLCVSGTPASAQGMACTTVAAAPGSCRSGLCVPELCGNGQLDSGEACEPAMSNCRADCQPGCRTDADCRNDDACDGEERCDMSTRECRRGVRVECVDADACTVNGICDPASGCMFRLIDEDRDGYSPPGCAASSGRAPDCNDTNVTVSPGAVERCDGIDNDCDGQIDEGVLLSCFADDDADGYPSRDEVRRGCECPPRSIAIANPATYEEWDCWDDPLDRGRDVHPGQTAFFEDGYGPGGRSERSFDYDCDGVPTPRYAPLDVQGCTGLLGLVCAQKQGFMRPPPACGESGSYVVCTMGALACQGAEDSRKQACR
jgi:cysteine-rich repeat protein